MWLRGVKGGYVSMVTADTHKSKTNMPALRLVQASCSVLSFLIFRLKMLTKTLIFRSTLLHIRLLLKH